MYLCEKSKKLDNQIIRTADGSDSLISGLINESYHSTHGAIQESMHIFINAGFRFLTGKDSVSVLEIGFGTGLNTLLTIAEAVRRKVKVNYVTIEKFPVSVAQAIKLNYPEMLGIENAGVFFQNIHGCDWNTKHKFNDCFVFEKDMVDFLNYQPAEMFDLVYFDAFSPEKQPEMWEEKQLLKVYNACNSGAVLTTYCAKGEVRRRLQSVGFVVERIPGPPGKREMLRAVKV